MFSLKPSILFISNQTSSFRTLRDSQRANNGNEDEEKHWIELGVRAMDVSRINVGNFSRLKKYFYGRIILYKNSFFKQENVSSEQFLFYLKTRSGKPQSCSQVKQTCKKERRGARGHNFMFTCFKFFFLKISESLTQLV